MTPSAKRGREAASLGTDAPPPCLPACLRLYCSTRLPRLAGESARGEGDTPHPQRACFPTAPGAPPSNIICPSRVIGASGVQTPSSPSDPGPLEAPESEESLHHPALRTRAPFLRGPRCLPFKYPWSRPLPPSCTPPPPQVSARSDSGLTCLSFAQRLLQPIGPHILGVLGWVRVRVWEVVGGRAPATLLGPGRHGALGPGPTGPPAAPPAARGPVPPVGAGDTSVPAPPAAPHFSGGPQGAGLGPHPEFGGPLSWGRGGAGEGGSGPWSQHGRGGLRGPPLPSPTLAGPPPFLCLPLQGGCEARGRRMLQAEIPPAPPRALSPPPPPPLRLPPPPATSSFLSGTLTSPSGDSRPFPTVNPFGEGRGSGRGRAWELE